MLLDSSFQIEESKAKDRVEAMKAASSAAKGTSTSITNT